MEELNTLARHLTILMGEQHSAAMFPDGEVSVTQLPLLYFATQLRTNMIVSMDILRITFFFFYSSLKNYSVYN